MIAREVRPAGELHCLAASIGPGTLGFGFVLEFNSRITRSGKPFADPVGCRLQHVHLVPDC